MNYLLDTHALIWAIFDPRKLSKPAVKVISEKENNIYVSVVSLWEIALKYSVGKIELNGVRPEDLMGVIDDSGFKIFPLESDIVLSAYKLKKANHADPFDRMLIWQAIQENITMISRDDAFNKYEQAGLKLFW